MAFWMQEIGAGSGLGLGIDNTPVRLSIRGQPCEYGPRELESMDLQDLIDLYKVDANMLDIINRELQDSIYSTHINLISLELKRLMSSLLLGKCLHH